MKVCVSGIPDQMLIFSASEAGLQIWENLKLFQCTSSGEEYKLCFEAWENN